MTDADWIALIIAELTDDSSGTLAINVPLYWARRADVTDLELRYLLVKRDAIDLLIGTLRMAVDVTSDGDSVKASQMIGNLLTIRASVDLLIARSTSPGALTMVPASYGTTTTDEFGRPPWWWRP